MCAADISSLRQGDVLRGGRIFFQNDRLYSIKKCVRKGRAKLKVVEASKLAQHDQLSIVLSRPCDLAIITQSCDIRRDELILAPVYPLHAVSGQDCEPGYNDWAHNVRSQKLGYAYCLPLEDGLNTHYPESYIDVRVACTILKDVVASFFLVRTLGDVEREEFRKFLFNHFGRPAIEDEVVEAISPMTKILRNSKFHPVVHSIWINTSSNPLKMLVILNESHPSLVQRLTLSSEQANTSGLKIRLKCPLKSNVKLTDIEGYKRIAYENLSFGEPTDIDSTDLEF